MTTSGTGAPDQTTSELGWAVLGAGKISRTFADQLPRSTGGRLVRVGSRDAARATPMAEELGVTAGSYAEVLADPAVDAVYIGTVHTTHAELAVAALRAGKHVLCEKPMAPTSAEVMTMVDTARATGRVLVEAFMYRFHPQTRRLLQLVADGAIGQLLHVDAAFGFATGATEGRLLDPALAGGAILDVGCYPVSMARAVVAASRATAVADPVAVTGGGTLEGGVDAWAVGTLDFGDVTATVRTGVRLAESGVTVHGTRGSIRVQDPWTIGAEQSLTISVVGQEPVVERFSGEASYALEADGLAAAVGTGESRIMSLADSLGNAKVLDQWRAALGLVYPFETDEAPFPAPLVAPLQRGVDADGSPGRMRHARIPGVDKDVSRLVMGCDNQQTPAHAAAMFDSFFAAGGTTFDTAWLYGRGRQEELLGRWVRERGVRDEVVIITKGAHSPHCDPESISRQLLESLERQGTEHAEIYLMHRDNAAVPVGEFVDVLDEHARAGRIGVFGGSNWTPARFDEANAYAEANGRQGFSVLSNHFGLAEALDVPWQGCEHATDRASKQWLAERGVTLLPWSSQARGFFTGRAHPDDHSDPELVRCYYSEDNFERLRRAESLAGELGVPTTAIALAFVLQQDFPTFALIGPRSIAETRSSMAALDVELTPEQLAWLDLR